MASDDFNRADETPLAAPWFPSTGSTGTFNLSSQAIVAANLSDKFYYYSGACLTANQYSQFTIGSGGMDAGPAVRISGVAGSGPTAYWFSIFSRLVRKMVDGSTTTIYNTGLPALSAGDLVRLEVNDTLLTVKINGVPAPTSGNDSTITGVGQGVGAFYFFQDPGHFLDNFSGGDTVEPGLGDNPPIGFLGRGAGW